MIANGLVNSTGEAATKEAKEKTAAILAEPEVGLEGIKP